MATIIRLAQAESQPSRSEDESASASSSNFAASAWNAFESLARRAASSKILVLVLCIQAALIILRALNLSYTGFQTADEVNYIFDLMVGRPYGNRLFFNDQLFVFFQIFGIDSISRFAAFFPFYLAFWTFSFIILAYKTLGLVTRSATTRNFVMFSLPFAISYSLLSVGLLTEGPALTMCMLGIYSWLRYSKIEKKWYLVVISAAAFLAAAYSREPYDIFPVAGAAAWIGLGLLRKVPAKHAATFVLISLVLATPNSPYYSSRDALVSVPSNVQTAQFSLPVTTITMVVTHVGTGTRTVTVVEVSNGTTTTATTTTIETFTTTMTTSTTTTEQPGLLSVWATIIRNSLVLFFYGMFLGLGPTLFFLSIISFIMLFWRWRGGARPWGLILFVLLSLGTFYGSTIFLSDETHFLLTQGLSNLIRLTNSTIPAYILLSALAVDRLKVRGVKILSVVLIVVTLGTAGYYVTAVQTNLQLPYNVIQFSNVTEALQARNHLVGNSSYTTPTIVFLSSGWEGAQLYLRGIPGLVMYPTLFTSWDALHSNFTEKYFEMLRPTVFYVLSENNLADWNSSASLATNVNRMMAYQSPFLLKTFAYVFHESSGVPMADYDIASVTVSNSPTGLFMEVHVQWHG